jgi:hypothetical protein
MSADAISNAHVIGRAALIKNKRAAGRGQDLADIQAIEPKQD